MTPKVSKVSARSSRKVENLYAVVVKRRGHEGVVRRDTPSGTQPWITDDVVLVDFILTSAIEGSGYKDAYVARFQRVE